MCKKACFPSTVPTSGRTESDLMGTKARRCPVHGSTSTRNHPVRRRLVNADVNNVDPGRYLSSDRPRAQPKRNKRIDRANSSSSTDHRKENMSLKVCSPSGTKGSSLTASGLTGAKMSVSASNVDRASKTSSSLTASGLLGAKMSVSVGRAPKTGSSRTASDLTGAKMSVSVGREPKTGSFRTASDLIGAKMSVQVINVHRAPKAGSSRTASGLIGAKMSQVVHA